MAEPAPPMRTAWRRFLLAYLLAAGISLSVALVLMISDDDLLPMGREAQMLGIAIVAGAMGGSIHALQRLADLTVKGTLAASWFCWHLIRPLVGGSTALIVYAVVRGGFLTSSADSKQINTFAITALAALAGMFSDKATRKLGDMFDTIFRKKGERRDTAPEGR